MRQQLYKIIFAEKISQTLGLNSASETRQQMLRENLELYLEYLNEVKRQESLDHIHDEWNATQMQSQPYWLAWPSYIYALGRWFKFKYLQLKKRYKQRKDKINNGKR